MGGTKEAQVSDSWEMRESHEAVVVEGTMNKSTGGRFFTVAFADSPDRSLYLDSWHDEIPRDAKVGDTGTLVRSFGAWRFIPKHECHWKFNGGDPICPECGAYKDGEPTRVILPAEGQ